MKHLHAVADRVVSHDPSPIHDRSYAALALCPEGLPDEAFLAALDEDLSAHSARFDNTPVILDLEHVSDQMDVAQLRGLLAALKKRPMSLMGLQNGTRAQIAVARAAGLIAVRAGEDVTPEPVPEPEPAALAQATGAARIVTNPVRSGQKLYAEHGDLIVIAPVGAGAELVASGNIHVYGPLRGRALAGVGGDEGARIFCQSLHAELIAIAGVYQTSENLDPAFVGQPVQIALAGDALDIAPLK